MSSVPSRFLAKAVTCSVEASRAIRERYRQNLDLAAGTTAISVEAESVLPVPCKSGGLLDRLVSALNSRRGLVNRESVAVCLIDLGVNEFEFINV